VRKGGNKERDGGKARKTMVQRSRMRLSCWKRESESDEAAEMVGGGGGGGAITTDKNKNIDRKIYG